MEPSSISDWFNWLSITSSKFIHVAVCGISFLLKAEQYPSVCTHLILFIRSTTCGQLSCFPLFAIVNSVAANMGIKISLQNTAFNSLDLYSEVGLLGHDRFLIFWGTSILFPIAVTSFCNPTNSAQGFQCLHILTNTCSFVFLIIAILMSVLLTCISLWISDVQYLFLCLLAIWGNVYASPLCNRAVWFFVVDFSFTLDFRTVLFWQSSSSS